MVTGLEAERQDQSMRSTPNTILVDVVVMDIRKLSSPVCRVAGTVMRADTTASSKAFWPEAPRPNSAPCGQIVEQDINIDLLRAWVRSCDSEHGGCRSPSFPSTGERGIRLLDLEEDRIISTSLAEEYVALSYVWGNAAPLLTRSTLAKYTSLHGLRGSIIPRTIMDAARVVYAIGKRYLWVDSLCIIQDDESDKQQQLPIMDSIYSHADLLIIAATGDDASAGLPGVWGTPRNLNRQTSSTINGIDFVTVQPDTLSALGWTEWNSRGWTFQEAHLSRRALVFTDDTVYWNCQRHMLQEEIVEAQSGKTFASSTSTERSIWGGMTKLGLCRTSLYCDFVSAFSNRRFGDESDVLWAFTGILKRLKPRFQKGFIWAVPYELLDASLLWSDAACGHCQDSRTLDASHLMAQGNISCAITYPSWSWLSHKTRVSFVDSCKYPVVSRLTWHPPFKIGDDDEPSTTSPRSINNSRGSIANTEYCRPDINWLSGIESLDFGLLHFTARTAELYLTRSQESSISPYTCPDCDIDHIRTRATIRSPKGRSIAGLDVPVSFFKGTPERLGELVMLSSITNGQFDEDCKVLEGSLDCDKKVQHVDGCSHILCHYIMLIEWVQQIAYRRGLCKIGSDAWKQIETQEKIIVLG